MMTVREIAKATGLSPATVSRAMKLPHLVKPHTRELITKFLNGKENKALESIHILVPDLTDYPINEIITVLSDYLYDEDVNLVLHTSKNNLETEEKILRRMSAGSSNNGVLLWHPIPHTRPENFFYPTLPTVLMYSDAYTVPFACSLQLNSREFFKNACQALYRGGAQKILILIDHEYHLAVAKETEALYTEILQSLNKRITFDFLYTGQSDWQTVYHMLSQAYGANFPFDGVISPSTKLAYSLITFCKYYKIAVPTQTALITYGYDFSLELMATPISMIHPNAPRIAEQILYALIQIFYDPLFSCRIHIEPQLYLLGSERKY